MPDPLVTLPAKTARRSPRCCHTGYGFVPTTLTTDLAIVVTELYVCEIEVLDTYPVVTGIALQMGSATEGSGATGTQAMLFDADGVRIASSADTDVSGFTADAYGNIPFTAPIALAPGTYYVGVISGVNTNKIAAHVIGSFGAGKIESLVYSTEAGYASITPPTTFTTGLGPVAALY